MTFETRKVLYLEIESLVRMIVSNEGSPFIFHMRLIQLLSFPLKHTVVINHRNLPLASIGLDALHLRATLTTGKVGCRTEPLLDVFGNEVWIFLCKIKNGVSTNVLSKSNHTQGGGINRI